MDFIGIRFDLGSDFSGRSECSIRSLGAKTNIHVVFSRKIIPLRRRMSRFNPMQTFTISAISH
jgi:hypothetical protein